MLARGFALDFKGIDGVVVYNSHLDSCMRNIILMVFFAIDRSLLWIDLLCLVTSSNPKPRKPFFHSTGGHHPPELDCDRAMNPPSFIVHTSTMLVMVPAIWLKASASWASW